MRKRERGREGEKEREEGRAAWGERARQGGREGGREGVREALLQRLLAHVLQPNEFVVHFRRQIAIRRLERQLELRKHRIILRVHSARRLHAHINLLERLELFHRTQRLSNQLQRLGRVLRLDRLQFVEALPALGF